MKRGKYRQCYMKPQPCDSQPARPILSPKHEDPGNHSEQLDEFDQENVPMKAAYFWQVKSEHNDPYRDEEPGNASH